jgi:hypothetical protein
MSAAASGAKPASAVTESRLQEVDRPGGAIIQANTAGAASSQEIADAIDAEHGSVGAAEVGPDDFDWANDDAVVVKPRPGVAVYENKFGDVVVRTQHTAGDEDFFTYIPAERLAAVIAALKDYLP